MSTQYTQQGGSVGADDRHDPARSADGQTARSVANISGEPSIDRAREAFERADLGGARGGSYREPTDARRSDEKGTKSGITGGSRRQKFSGVGGAGSSSTALTLLCGVGLGSALIYFLAPERRRGRRAPGRGELTMKKCGDVMTGDPACCLPGDTVERAAQLMRGEDVGPVPVVSDHQTKKLVGIVTDRDLALKVVAEARDAKVTRVEDVMTKGVVACRAEDALQEALDAMAEHRVRRIPVVDADDRIVGIIAQADVATRAPERTAEVVEEISRSGAAGV